MSRYIDADHAEFRLQCCGTYHGVIAFDTVKAVLNDVPSINIVFCHECKRCHYDDEKDLYRCTKSGMEHWMYKADIHYCDYGERKESE